VELLTLFKEMMETESGKFVTKEYLKTGRSMREFEQKVCLFRVIRTITVIYSFPRQQLYKQWCDSVEQIATARLNNFILVEDPEAKEIVVNFHPDLISIIRETKYLDKLGYTIPETALNITLQVIYPPLPSSMRPQCDFSCC
jgi:dynein heavy chain